MERIVAVEAGTEGLTLYRHGEKGGFVTEQIPFLPWTLASAAVQAPAGAGVVALSGDGFFCRRWEFSDITAYESALDGLKRSPELMVIRDLVQQALSVTGVRLFSGMDFADLRRMQFAIEVSPSETIAAIMVARNGVEVVRWEVDAGEDEASVIRNFNEAVTGFDPDVLEGYNCCRIALPVLEKRAKKLKVALSCGRDGKGFGKRASRFSPGGRSVSYNRYSLCGRHLIDLLHLAMFHDAVYRDFEDLELATLRQHFDLPEGVSAVEIIAALGDMWLVAPFYRCGSVPLSFQDSIMRGTGSALDALLIAEYQRRNAAVPLPEEARFFAGALTASGHPGVFHAVRHCDVRSLYPSILLMLGRSPRRDTLGVFLEKLRMLRRFRLEAKDRAAALPPGAEKEKFRALQSSFKVLINSFYGYLGFAQGAFNDYDLAETVTARGREILQTLSAHLQSSGAEIVEMDTDGIYFCMPANPPDDFDEMLKQQLPDGIELDFDAEYPAMYAYKSKNYALLKADGTIYISGAALKSRALENYQRTFIKAALQAKLLDAPEIMEQEYLRLQQEIIQRTLPLADLAKSEVLSDSPENYQRKQGKPGSRRSAPYELALASGRGFRAGDQVKFYVTGEKAKLPVVGNSKLLEDALPGVRDENSAYYLAKLDELYRQFKNKE